MMTASRPGTSRPASCPSSRPRSNRRSAKRWRSASPSTAWPGGQGRDKDRPQEPRYAAFAGAVEKARAQDIAARVARVTRAGRGGAVVQRRTVTQPDGSSIVEERFSEPQWTADMTMLERRYPEEFARRVALEHGGGVGVIDFAAIVTEARRRADARRQARLLGPSSTPAPPPPPVELQETPHVPRVHRAGAAQPPHRRRLGRSRVGASRVPLLVGGLRLEGLGVLALLSDAGTPREHPGLRP